MPTGEPLENIDYEAYPSENFEEHELTEENTASKTERHSNRLTIKRKQKTSDSITDMIMGNSYLNSKTSTSTSLPTGFEVVDTTTLVSQTQNRMQKALNDHYRYDSSLKDSQGFLFKYVNSSHW